MARASSGTGPTVQFESLGLMLDHIFVQGMAILASGMARQAVASDHLPIWAFMQPRVAVVSLDRGLSPGL